MSYGLCPLRKRSTPCTYRLKCQNFSQCVMCASLLSLSWRISWLRWFVSASRSVPKSKRRWLDRSWPLSIEFWPSTCKRTNCSPNLRKHANRTTTLLIRPNRLSTTIMTVTEIRKFRAWSSSTTNAVTTRALRTKMPTTRDCPMQACARKTILKTWRINAMILRFSLTGIPLIITTKSNCTKRCKENLGRFMMNTIRQESHGTAQLVSHSRTQMRERQTSKLNTSFTKRRSLSNKSAFVFSTFWSSCMRRRDKSQMHRRRAKPRSRSTSQILTTLTSSTRISWCEVVAHS